MSNPPIPLAPCVICGRIQAETQSVIGAACLSCFKGPEAIRLVKQRLERAAEGDKPKDPNTSIGNGSNARSEHS